MNPYKVLRSTKIANFPNFIFRTFVTESCLNKIKITFLGKQEANFYVILSYKSIKMFVISTHVSNTKNWERYLITFNMGTCAKVSCSYLSVYARELKLQYNMWKINSSSLPFVLKWMGFTFSKWS